MIICSKCGLPDADPRIVLQPMAGIHCLCWRKMKEESTRLERSSPLAHEEPSSREQLKTVMGRIDSLFAAIAHGSDAHRAWLKAAIEAHFAGRPAPPPA